MKHEAFDQILAALAVEVEEFAVCEFTRDSAIIIRPLEAIEIHFVLAGSLHLQIDGEPLAPLPPGSVVIVPPGTRQQMAGTTTPTKVLDSRDICSVRPDGLLLFDTASDENAKVRIICGEIHAGLGGSFGPFDDLVAPICANLAAEPLVRLAFQTMLREADGVGLGSRALVGSLMKSCLVLALRDHAIRHGIEQTLPGLLGRPSLARAVAAVLKDPAAPFTLGGLAKTAGMSRSSFAKVFTSALRVTPMEFVARTRLNEAQKLILSTTLPVSAVASKVGFTNRSHFTRAFRNAFGIDPSGMRRVGSTAETADVF